MIDPNVKAKWILALRSGAYVQGQGQLRSSLCNSYCCLGVLCEVTKTPYVGSDCSLSGDVQQRLGLTVAEHNKLIFLNDGDLRNTDKIQNFSEIADWIEANL